LNTVILDKNLNFNDKYLKKQAFSDFAQANSDYKIDYNDNIISQSLFLVDNNLQEEKNEVFFQRNYLEYLEQCWGAHLGVVLSPDIIWHELLCELALIIAEQPEIYRSLFSTTQDKQEITVFSDSLTVLPLDKIVAELQKKVPDEFTESFLPEFSTRTERSLFAHQAALADAVSPYYNYSMKICGIPYIKIDGVYTDWVLLEKNWVEITHKFLKLDVTNINYFHKVQEVIANIRLERSSAEFYKKMFYLEKCGSGSDTEVFGWITDLFRKQPEHVRKVSNFSTHIAEVKYKQLNLDKDFVMKSGLLRSQLEDDLLIPDFGYLVYEKKKKSQTIPFEKKEPVLKIYESGFTEKILTGFKIKTASGLAIIDNRRIIDANI
jgi:hypothetical protein